MLRVACYSPTLAQIPSGTSDQASIHETGDELCGYITRTTDSDSPWDVTQDAARIYTFYSYEELLEAINYFIRQGEDLRFEEEPITQ